ncbi:YraN family protein [Duganella sp. CY15W]|uniref:YraN family protein n=1 Tax=Duganella sp. CY15W TaxID=2692172 RepID=UPI00136AC27D|nr:YraN family protein [Duganella sp. CY15W]MYM29372.1 YraN family protein [Duganella sp. CY15W]
MPRTPQQRLGRQGEDRALAHLQDQGLTLLERNFLCKAGEIDLIMLEGPVLVFVEVRQRASARFGGAVYSVTPAKQQRLLRAAQYYLLRHKIPPPCRFDLIAIDEEKLSWVQNVLEM